LGIHKRPDRLKILSATVKQGLATNRVPVFKPNISFLKKEGKRLGIRPSWKTLLNISQQEEGSFYSVGNSNFPWGCFVAWREKKKCGVQAKEISEPPQKHAIKNFTIRVKRTGSWGS